MKTYIIGLVMFMLIGAFLTKMHGFSGKASAAGAVIGVTLMCIVLLMQARTQISIARCVLTAFTAWVIVYDLVLMIKPDSGSKSRKKAAEAAQTEAEQEPEILPTEHE